MMPRAGGNWRAQAVACATLVLCLCTHTITALVYNTATVELSFADLTRQNVPYTVDATSIEWQIKFSRAVRTTVYYPTTTMAGAVPSGPSQVIMWANEYPQTFGTLPNAAASQGMISVVIELENLAEPLDYARDVLFIMQEILAEGASSDSPLFGRVGTKFVLAGFGAGADAGYQTQLQGILISGYTLPTGAGLKGVIAVGARTDMPGVLGGAGHSPTETEIALLVLAGSTDCLYSAEDSALPQYIEWHGCKTFVEVYGGNQCYFTTQAALPSPLPPGLRPCIQLDTSCGARPEISRAIQQTFSDPVILSWSDYILNGNITAFTDFRTRLLSPSTPGRFFQSCIVAGTHYDGSLRV